jgi:hypothetical protein
MMPRQLAAVERVSKMDLPVIFMIFVTAFFCRFHLMNIS